LLAKTFAGTVARFSGSVNADTRTMSTEVDVVNKDLVLVPGMYAYADLALDRAPGALTVPVQAVDRDETKASVVVVVNGHAERRQVKTGLETPDRVEITDGVHESDYVVLGNRAQIKPGAAVAPKVVS
jgi:multidrug efflux pump subunit AcrA (membrane-fusion protein)